MITIKKLDVIILDPVQCFFHIDTNMKDLVALRMQRFRGEKFLQRLQRERNNQNKKEDPLQILTTEDTLEYSAPGNSKKGGFTAKLQTMWLHSSLYLVAFKKSG